MVVQHVFVVSNSQKHKQSRLEWENKEKQPIKHEEPVENINNPGAKEIAPQYGE